MFMSKEKEQVQDAYKNINSLSALQLNAMCTENGINPKRYGKKSRVNLLCCKLGISTSGNEEKENTAVDPFLQNHNLTVPQMEEFRKLKPGYLVTMNGWTKDLARIPELDDGMVKQYLCRTKIIPPNASRQYKLCRPYQLKDFIHSMRFHPQPIPTSSTFVVIEAQCNPSQSSSSDDVKVLFVVMDSITGQPYGGYCTCTAGFCQSCGHIGAALFRLADLVACGYTSLPDDPSCTDKLCPWIDPKGAAVAPKLLDNIVVGKAKVQRRTISQYGSLVVGPDVPRKPTHQQVMKLRDGLFRATQHLGQHVPAVHVLTPSNFQDEPLTYVQPIFTKLPEVVLENDQSLAPARVVSVTSYPFPIAFYPGKLPIETFVTSLKSTEDERQMIEISTRGQNENIEWYHQRMGAITSSVSGDILRLDEGAKISPQRLVGQIMGYRHRNMRTPKLSNRASLKWGHASEKKARTKYSNIQSSTHENLSVSETGLCIHAEESYLRASPDGLVTCDCHPPRLLEIKSPWTAREMDIPTAVQEKKVQYLLPDGEGYHLRRDKEYYAQVQMGMSVTGTQTCDFVVYTTKDMVTLCIPFDLEYWSRRLKPSLTRFFIKHVVPAIFKDQDIGISGVSASMVSEVVTSEDSDEELKDIPLDVHVTEPEDCAAVKITRCGKCRIYLPEPDDIAADNSDASIGCDCQCGCPVWFCWSCAKYNDHDFVNVTWICPQCVSVHSGVSLGGPSIIS